MTSPIRKLFSILTAALIMFSLFTIIAETKPPTAAADTPASYFESPPGSDWGLLYTDDATENATAFSAAEVDGGYVFTGTQTGPAGPELDWWGVVGKINTSGTLTGDVTFSDDDDHSAGYDIIGVADGYVVAGTKHVEVVSGGTYYDPHIWLMKTNTSLVRQWEKTYGNPAPDRGNSVAADGTGFILGGFQGDGGSGTGWIINTDASGSQQWEGKSIFADDTTWWMGKEVYSAKKASDGGYILGTADGIRKTATTGTPPAHSWTAAAGDPYNSVQQTADGGYIGVGTRSDDDTADGTYDILLTKLSATGAVQWSNTYSSDSLVPDIDLEPGELPHDYGRHVVQTSDGGYAIVGETDTITHDGTTFYGNGENDLWILKVNGSGVLQWDLALGGDGNDSGHHIIETSDDDLLVSGSATVSGGARQMWVIKVNGDFTPPTPAFTYTPDSPVFVGQQVSFDASASTDADGTITDYEWDFGDGNTGTGVTDDHTYRTPGTYTITLAVTDNDGTTRSTSDDVTVAQQGMAWERIIDGSEPNVGFAIVEAHDGGYVIAGNTENGAFGGSATDAWLLKINDDSTIAWEKKYQDTIQPTKVQSFMDVARTSDGGYIVTGRTDTSISATPSDIWLMKTDGNGVREWDEKFGGAFWDEGQAVAQTADGGYIVTGFMSSASPYDSRDVFLLKTNGSGVQTWLRTFTDPDAYSGYAVAEVTGGGYIIATAGSDSDTDIQLIKTNSTGESPSTTTWNGTSSNAAGTWIAETADRGFAIAGTLNRSFSLLKTTSAGAKDWEKSFDDGTNDAYGQHAATTPDGGYIIVGYTEDIPDDVYMVKTDSAGNKEWDSIFGTTEYDTGAGILALADGSYVVMYNRSNLSGDTDLCIRMYGNTGVFSTSGAATVTEWSVTEDPGLDPGTYDPTGAPAGADLDNARGFEITATGADGTYNFRINFTTPISSDFTLYKLPGWTEVPYTVIDEYTIEVSLTITGGVLDPPFMLVPNTAPNQPGNTAPANAATGISVTPTLSSSAFSDVDTSDTHAASQWLITATSGSYGSALYDSGTDATNKTSVTVPSSTLATNTTYYFKVRYRDNHDEWSAWSFETSFTTLNTAPNQPTNSAPANAATGVSLTPTLGSSAFADSDTGDTHAASQWQISSTSGDYSTTVYDSETDTTNKTSITIPASTLSYSATYYFRVRYQDNRSTWSAWSSETSFTTMAQPVTNTASSTPVNVSPADSATGVSVTPTLESSAFYDSDTGDTHAASQWQVTTTAGNYTSPTYDSSTDTSNKTSIAIPAATISNSATYYWHVRHKDSYGNWSVWSAETSFTTAGGGGGCGASAAAASASDIASGWGILGLLGVSGAYTGWRQKKRKTE